MNITKIPTYDKTILPTLIKPYTRTQKNAKRYLGDRIGKNKMQIDFSYHAKTEEQLTLFYDFWKDDCNYGTGLFGLEIELFNLQSKNNIFVMSFLSDFTTQNNAGVSSTGKITLQLEYALNEFGDFIEI